MKTLAVLICVFNWATISVAASTDHSNMHGAYEKPAVHGMVLFGTKTLYSSHMPMLHAPHDYQAIFEVSLDEGGATAYATAKKADADQMVTIVPEPFVLTEMIAHPTPFYADVYSGHFERGGKLIASHVQVSITQVVHAHKLGAPSPNAANLISFGDEWSFDGKLPETYQAHFIGDQAPEFDEIQQIDNRPRGTGEVKTIYREEADLSQ